MLREYFARIFGIKIVDFLKGTEINKYYHFYSKIMNWDRKALEEYQYIKLRQLLHHAYKNVPFYTKRFDENNLTPDSFKSLTDLQKLPPLTRTDMQKCIKELISLNANISKCIKDSSSGSTGQPVIFYHDMLTESTGIASGMVGWSLGGWKNGEKHMYIWGNPSSLDKWKRPSSKIKKFLLNYERFPAFHLNTEEGFKNLHEKVIHFKPLYLDGYSHSIYKYALYLAKNNLSYACKGVFTTAEKLYPYQKDLIQKSLGKVHDSYGCSEINGIANECSSQDGYHLLTFHIIFEINSSRNGPAVTVTDLNNYSFPFIRYQNSDLCMGNKIYYGCSCGSKLPKIEGILGRESDIVENDNGGFFAVPSFLGGKIFQNIKGVEFHQVIAKKDNSIQVNLVVNQEFQDSDKRVLEKYLAEYLDTIKWEIKISDSTDILVFQSNKFKIFLKEQ